MKWLKFVIGLLLLPACYGAAIALWRLAGAVGAAGTVWVAVLAGAACWLVIFCLLPKPMWLYVVGHEATHAAWAWLFGGRVKRFRASSQGGYVVLTRSNFLVALAPYFFPIYAAAVVALFAVGDWIWGWDEFSPFFHLVLGAAYAFHLTLTAHTLRTRQSDITGQGYLFSAAIIFLGNAVLLLAGVPLLTDEVSLRTVLHWWAEPIADLPRHLSALAASVLKR